MFLHRGTLLLLAALALSSYGCDKSKSNEEQPPPAATTAEQVVPAPADTIEKESESLTLVMAATAVSEPAALADFETFLTTETGVTTKIELLAGATEVIDTLRSGDADIARFAAWPYLVAHHRANMEVLVVEVRGDKTTHDSHWVIRADSKIKDLRDLKGKAIAFSNAASAAGYLFPSASLFEAKILGLDDDPGKIFSEVEFAGTEAAALQRLLGKTSEAVSVSASALAELTPEERKLVKVLHTQGPVPNASISVRSGLAPEVKEKLKAALLKLNEEGHRPLLKRMFGADGFAAQEQYEYTDRLEKVIEIVAADLPL